MGRLFRNGLIDYGPNLYGYLLAGLDARCDGNKEARKRALETIRAAPFVSRKRENFVQRFLASRIGVASRHLAPLRILIRKTFIALAKRSSEINLTMKIDPLQNCGEYFHIGGWIKGAKNEELLGATR